jgi:hypothetical protein
MQTMYVLMLQGTGDDEYAYESAGVFTSKELAVAKADAINAEYDDFAIAYKITHKKRLTKCAYAVIVYVH